MILSFCHMPYNTSSSVRKKRKKKKKRRVSSTERLSEILSCAHEIHKLIRVRAHAYTNICMLIRPEVDSLQKKYESEKRKKSNHFKKTQLSHQIISLIKFTLFVLFMDRIDRIFGLN